MSERWVLTLFTIGTVAAIGLTSAAIIVPMILADRANCLRVWERFEPEYRFVGGCLIRVDGELIPSRQYIINQPEPR